MDDRDSRFRPIAIILVVVGAVAVLLWFNRTEVTHAVDETVDVFVPDAEEFERRTSAVGEARRLVDQLNTR